MVFAALRKLCHWGRRCIRNATFLVTSVGEAVRAAGLGRHQGRTLLEACEPRLLCSVSLVNENFNSTAADTTPSWWNVAVTKKLDPNTFQATADGYLRANDGNSISVNLGYLGCAPDTDLNLQFKVLVLNPASGGCGYGCGSGVGHLLVTQDYGSGAQTLLE